jgi:rhamnogalacturonyl hydrolase YesR
MAFAGTFTRPAPGQWAVAYADSLMARFPDPDSIPHRAWCYTQGYVLRGFEMLHESTKDRRYRDYVVKFADQHVDAAGNISGFRGASLDDMMAGTAVVAAYRYTGEKRYKLAADRIREAFRDYPRNSDGGFYHAKSPTMAHEMWIDGVFMGGMFLLGYGEHVADREACSDEVARQILIFASHGRKGKSGLFLHGYDEDKDARWADRETGLSPEVWSEGLGWHALVVVETLKVLPADHPKRAEILKLFRDLAEGLRRTQDAKTGLWYQVVDEGERPDNWHDSSGSGMFVYAIQRGVDLGFVDRDTYAPVARRGYEGLTGKASVNERYGLIDIHDACDGLGVQKSYADYINYPRRINAKEAMGSFLWATAIVEKPGPLGGGPLSREQRP